MNKFALVIVFFLFSMQACIENKSINGNGQLTQFAPKINNFKSIIVDLPAKVNVNCKDSNTSTCSINAEANTLQYIVCAVENDELILTIKKNTTINFTKPITITITTATLEEIKVLGSSDVKVNGSPHCNTFIAAIMGSGNIEINNGHYQAIKAELSGSGNIMYNNSTAISANYDLKGSGNIQANFCLVSDVHAVLTGSGNIQCYAIKTLDGRLAGSGNINYLGKPTIISNISGNGNIIAQ